MAIRRVLDHTEDTGDGTAYAVKLDDTINWLSGQMLGELITISGTANAITAELTTDTDFVAESNDAYCLLKPSSATTGAVTLTIESGSALGVRDEAGVALSATRGLIAGTAYLLHYNSTDGWWRVISFLVAGTGAGAVSAGPYIHTECFVDDGTFTAPFACNARIIAIGGGGGGGGVDVSNGRAAGGGAGGFASLEVAMAVSETLTIVVGDAGAGVADTAGTAGGNTTVDSASPVVDIDALGGGGGAKAATASTGGTGGAATGGDFNHAGGDGGTATNQDTGMGGGAIGVIADGIDAGDSGGTNEAGNGAGFHATDTQIGFLGCNYGGLDINNALGGAGVAGASGVVVGANGGNGCGGGGASQYGGSGSALGGNGGVGGGGGGGTTGDSGDTGTGGQGGQGVVIVFYTADKA